METVTSPEKLSFKRQLGLVNGVTIIVGSVIGSGIFVSPKGVLQEAGSPAMSLMVWVMCGIVTAIGATCYAELGTCIKESGSDFAYLRRTYGKLIAFLDLWTSLAIVGPSSKAIVALVFASYVTQPIFHDECQVPKNLSTLIAATVIVLLTFLNCFQIKWVARVQDILTFTKVFALVAIIISGIVYVAKGNTDNLRWDAMFQGTTTNPGSVGMAFYSCWWAYSGSIMLTYVTEELKNPNRNLPFAIWISIGMICLLYLMINIAYFAVLTPHEILESGAVAFTYGRKLFKSWAWTIPLLVACSTFGSLNSSILTSPRTYVVAARYGTLPRVFGMIDVHRLTPTPALVYMGITSLLTLCVTDVYVLINYFTFVDASFNTITVSTLLYLRWKEPNLHRPIKVPLVLPILYIGCNMFFLLVPLFENPKENLIGVALTLLGIPVYLICVTWKKPKGFNDWMTSATIFIQKLLCCAMEESKFE